MVARPNLLPPSEPQPKVPHSKALIGDCNRSANWLIVPTLPLDPKQVTGQLFWDSSAQVPAPHALIYYPKLTAAINTGAWHGVALDEERSRRVRCRVYQ